ncbi:hypothetical protein BDR22DRAFT_974536 [Usnea florida]
MALATTAVVAASTTAAAAYIDAKFHLSKDARQIWMMKSTERELTRAVKANRLSCLYFFDEAVRDWPDAEAIWSRDGVYTRKETYNRACQYAAYFLELGVRPGELVAFYLRNSPEFIFAWLGLWAIGCAPAMINFNLAGDALVHCLKISGAKIIIVDEEEEVSMRIKDENQRIEVKLGMQAIVLSADLKSNIAAKMAQRPDDSYREGLTVSFPSALFYTSGTTGLPKGAVFSASRMYLQGAKRADVAGQRRGPGGDKWYICMPMYHGTGGVNAMTCVMAGISLAIGKGFSVRNFWRDVRDSESTFFVYVGETARYLLAAPPSPLDKEHKVRCMHGNGLRPDVWFRFRERFGVPEVAEFFNSSEGMLSLYVWNRGDYSANCVGHHGALWRLVTRDIYVPVAIDHETNEITKDPKTGFAKRVPYNQGGEILVKLSHESDFQGYWRDSMATKKKLARDVFKTGDLYYRTGDALKRTDDGRWYFVDRLGDTYRWKSENISTAEVADVIGKFPGIFEANVYGVEVPRHEGRAGCAALSIAPGHRKEFDWLGLATHAKKQLPGYAVPVFVRVLSSEVGGAASHNNKQNKVALRAEGIEPSKKGSKVAGGEGDDIYWIPPKSDRYVPMDVKDWQGLVGGTAKL